MSEELKLDRHYHEKKLRLVLRDLAGMPADEYARALIRLANVADDSVMREPEFSRTLPQPAAVELLRPLGYLNKKDVARLQDEITWDGTYLTVGVDHWAQWQEDTPYDHLQAIYTHPATVPAGCKVVPVVPTEIMRKAAQDKLASEGLIVTDWLIHTAYSAMIDSTILEVKDE